MIEQHNEFSRIAVITSKNSIPILEAIAASLPTGYGLKEIELFTQTLGDPYLVKQNDNKSYTIIETPNDELFLDISEDGFSATISRIVKQASLEVQPNLADDEISKLAVLFYENDKTEVNMLIIPSITDLKGEKISLERRKTGDQANLIDQYGNEHIVNLSYNSNRSD